MLELTGADARGILGTLDIEWVHFVWNTWVLLAMLVLVWRFRWNRWLWLTALLSGWHEIEHIYIFLFVYLPTGISGTPGLLAQGGAIAGGLPIPRPDLHFLYNLVETIPLVLAFLHQVRRTAPVLRGRFRLEYSRRVMPSAPGAFTTRAKPNA